MLHSDALATLSPAARKDFAPVLGLAALEIPMRAKTPTPT